MPTAELEHMNWLAAVQHVPIYEKFPGGMGPVWAAYNKQVAEFIRAHKIASVHQMMEQWRARDETLAAIETALDWGWKNGGWPGPHLHFEGNMFPVNEVQWAAFSKPLVAGMVAKLKEANAVTFAQFQALG